MKRKRSYCLGWMSRTVPGCVVVSFRSWALKELLKELHHQYRRVVCLPFRFCFYVFIFCIFFYHNRHQSHWSMSVRGSSRWPTAARITAFVSELRVIHRQVRCGKAGILVSAC